MYVNRPGITLTLCVRYMIATHPHVERRVVAELDALGLLATPARPCPRELAYEDVGKLSVLTNCIKARCTCRTYVS